MAAKLKLGNDGGKQFIFGFSYRQYKRYCNVGNETKLSGTMRSRTVARQLGITVAKHKIAND